MSIGLRDGIPRNSIAILDLRRRVISMTLLTRAISQGLIFILIPRMNSSI